MEGTVIKLIIKAPNQQIKDQTVQCDIGWTVGRLKEHLTEVYPSKPERIHQKLIYSGQLLIDTTCLKDVLRQCGDQEIPCYTLHLVCPQISSAATTMEESHIGEDAISVLTRRNIGEHTRQIDSNRMENLSQNTSNFLTQNPSMQLYSTQYYHPRNSQQVAWMQQAYTHYFTQYMQLMAAQGIQLQASIPYVQQMNIDANDSVQNPYPNNVNNIGVEQQPPAAPDAADINAWNNNAAREEGAFNRDLLDFFYLSIKVVVLFVIIFSYCSSLRLLVVTFLGFTIYLYQGGFFRAQPILLPENNNARVENNNQVLQNEGVGPGPHAGPQQQNGQVPVVQAEARTNANEEIEEERPGALAFTWTFFSSFFASLIPDEPNVI